MRRLILLILMLALPAGVRAQSLAEHQARIDAWAEPLAQKLLALLPDPIDGLEEFTPWDYEFREPPTWGCPVSCISQTPIWAGRVYVVAEPELVARIEAQFAKAMAVAAKVVDNPADAKLQAEMRALEGQEKTLKDSFRRLDAEIRTNEGAPPQPRGMEGKGVRAGTIGGFPLYRFTFNDSSHDPVPAGVRFVVMIGPETFRPTRVKDISAMKNEAVTALVSVGVQGRNETIAADEAFARKLLERIDLAKLAALLKP